MPIELQGLRRLARRAALLLALAAPAAVSAGLFASSIYPAPKAAIDVAALPAGAELIEVTTADGLRVRGIYVAPAAGKPVVLALPGNASSAADAIAWTSDLRARGYGVMAVGYRGYSGNPGTPSAGGLASDADAFLAAPRERHPDRRLWIVGHSLGAAVGVALAVRQPPDGLITWGAFTALRDMTPAMGRALVPDDYRNVDRVAELSSPWLPVHGTADEVVPAAQGQALHQAASAPSLRGASVVGIGAGHAVDGAVLDAVMAVGDRVLDGGDLEPAGLSSAWKLIPFGQSKPLNP